MTQLDFQKEIWIVKSKWPDDPKFPIYIRISDGELQMIDVESYKVTSLKLENVLNRYENDPVHAMIDFFNLSIAALNNANAVSS